MAWQFTPYTVPLALAALIGTVGAAFAWHQREERMETWGVLVQVSLALWSLFTLLTVSATTLAWKRLWFALFLPTVPMLVVTTCLFVVHFVGQTDWLTRPRVAALLAFPVVTLAASLTNGTHGLLLTDIAVDRSGSVAVLTYEWGVGIYVLAVCAYGVAVGYHALLIRKVLRSRNVYRKISFVILLSAFLLAIVTVLSLAKVSPFPHFMLAPFVYLLVGVLLIVATGSVTVVRALPIDRLLAVVGSRFNDTVPLARDFVVEAVDNGIIVLDGSDRIVDINSTAKLMLGLDRPVGKELTTVARPERVLECGEIGPVLEGAEPVHELDDETWVETPDGNRCYQVTISALSDDDGSAHVILLHDITARKRREERLESQKEELQAQKQQLQHQNERLDEFAAIVSHDLRNPLNVASSYLELLEARLDGDDDTAAVDAAQIREMEQATDRMEAIIEDALTLAREGKAVTETEPVALDDLASDAWANVDTVDATLRVDTDRRIEADPGRLLTVFENCVRNSLDHGRDDVTVTVGDIDRPDTEGFFVADDGPGIPPEERERVFEHGFTTSDAGTGLGLAIVDDAASAHGWAVEVTDGETGGARLEFTGVNRPDDGSRIDAVLDDTTDGSG